MRSSVRRLCTRKARLKQLFVSREPITLHWVLQTNWFVADFWDVMIGVEIGSGRRKGGREEEVIAWEGKISERKLVQKELLHRRENSHSTIDT